MRDSSAQNLHHCRRNAAELVRRQTDARKGADGYSGTVRGRALPMRATVRFRASRYGRAVVTEAGSSQGEGFESNPRV